MPKKKLNEDDEITEKNVDLAVRKAINHYFDNGRMLDGIFWKHCIGLLQNKYKFELEKEE